MSPITLNLVFVVLVAAIWFTTVPLSNAQLDSVSIVDGDYGDYNGVNNTDNGGGAEGQTGCRKKVKAVYCITQGNKCSKDNDCCRNLYCSQTRRGFVCNNRRA